MTSLDPADVFRQEASELFEVLEGALLDLTLRPDDRELVDTAFRALHTIKGSGAMFGFDKVAAFTHEFETAFDLVRKGEVKPTGDLISVALAAKDFIRALIEAPESTDSIIGDAILADLQRFVGKEPPTAAVAADPEPATPEVRSAGWRLHLEFASHILCNGSNPLEVASEVDRYCSWPGQACGYKVGHSTINSLRDKAKAALGSKYDLRAFNDAVVLGGNVPMDVLAKNIDDYIARTKAA